MLLLLAVVIGVVSAGAAVGFHEAMVWIREHLYGRLDPSFLYGRSVYILAAIPALGGLAVGLLTCYVFGTREGHGIVDVMESVVKSSGFIRPVAAVEKIILREPQANKASGDGPRGITVSGTRRARFLSR